MSTFQDIGGYFGLEQNGTYVDHKSNLLKSGRLALIAILQMQKPTSLKIPYFICGVIKRSLIENNFSFSEYKINEALEIDEELDEDATYLYVNYFGLKRGYAQNLSEQLGAQLILDNTHDLFCPTDIFKTSWAFNSLRKFIGVPDGAQIFTPENVQTNFEHLPRNSQTNYTHLLERLANGAQAGYAAYQENESSLSGNIERCSQLSEDIFARLDRASIIKRRQENFKTLHMRLGHLNKMPSTLLLINDDDTPFSYPFLPKNDLAHEWFWKQRIFPPRLWPENNAEEAYPLEANYAKNIIHLPIDHRYGSKQMDYLIELILNHGR